MRDEDLLKAENIHQPREPRTRMSVLPSRAALLMEENPFEFIVLHS